MLTVTLTTSEGVTHMLNATTLVPELETGGILDSIWLDVDHVPVLHLPFTFEPQVLGPFHWNGAVTGTLTATFVIVTGHGRVSSPVDASALLRLEPDTTLTSVSVEVDGMTLLRLPLFELVDVDEDGE